THCFTCGHDLTERLAEIDRVKDERLYGLFPEFVPRLVQSEVEASIDRLREVDQDTFVGIIESTPGEWQVSGVARTAWNALLYQRAHYVAETIKDRLRLVPGSPPF